MTTKVKKETGKNTVKAGAKLKQSYFDGYDYKGFEIKVRLELAGYGEYKPARVCCPFSVYKMFRRLRESDTERLYSVHVDRLMHVIGVELVSKGPEDMTYATPRDVFKSAFLSSAHGIIFVHCHPSGSPLPTIGDVRFTEKFQDVGSILGVPVIDHVIIGRGMLYSFKYDVQKVLGYNSKPKGSSTDYIG